MSKDRNKDPNPDFKDQIENSHRAQLRSLARYVIQSLNLQFDERITNHYPTPEKLINFVIAELELDKFYTP